MGEHLSKLFWEKRHALGLSLGEAAKALPNRKATKAATEIDRFEKGNEPNRELVLALMAKYSLSKEEVVTAVESDNAKARAEWDARTREPIKMHIIVQHHLFVLEERVLPPEIETEADAEIYACSLAKSRGQRVTLVLTKRRHTLIDEQGVVRERHESTGPDNPARYWRMPITAHGKMPFFQWIVTTNGGAL